MVMHELNKKNGRLSIGADNLPLSLLTTYVVTPRVGEHCMRQCEASVRCLRNGYDLSFIKLLALLMLS